MQRNQAVTGSGAAGSAAHLILGGWAAWAGLVMLTLVLALAGCADATDPVVPPAQVGSVQVSPSASTVDVGDVVHLVVVVRSTAGDTLAGRAIRWSSSDTMVAKVSATGSVSALREGTTVISAESGGRTGQATIHVRATPSIPAVTALDPASVRAGGPGFVLKITGTGFRAESRLQWNGAARQTLFVSPTELHATIPPGDIAVVGTARLLVVNGVPGGGPSNEIEFPITPQTVPVMAVELGTAIAITSPGLAVPVSVKVRDGAGNVLTDRLVTWTSSNQLVATVNGSGVVSALSEGEALITATSEGRNATVALTVTARPYHLVFDDGTLGLAYLDLRLGGDPVMFWQHTPGTRAVDPHVSPDRRWYVYAIQAGGRSDLAVLDIATRTYRYMTSDGSSDQPVWSPNGDRIAFRSRRAGRSDIWVMAADGSGAVNVTAGMVASFEAQQPTWSPDGNSIAFSGGPNGLDPALYIIGVNGANVRRIETGPGPATEPSWHADAIAFTHTAAGGSTDIWRISVSGIGPYMQLTRSGNALMPAFSPDGRWVAFVERSQPIGPGRILAVRANGDDVRPITPLNGAAGGGLHPGWLAYP